MRRRLGHDIDPRISDLLATIERSVERLRQISEQVIAGAAEQDHTIVVTIVAGELGRPSDTPDIHFQEIPPPARPLPLGLPAADHQGPVLLIMTYDAVSEGLTQALATFGQPVIQAERTADGLDLAREGRPAAIVVDPHLDKQAGPAIGLLSLDPDTKDLPLLTLGQTPPQMELIERRSITVLDPQHSLAQQAMVIVQTLRDRQFQHSSTRHVLIVDDEPEIGTILALELREEGYTTTLVRQGADALRVVREHHFDLILLDLLLPDIDGFAVLGGLRAQPETQITPIILISAINSPADKVRGLQLGADDYITKPFSGPELLARVQATMRRSEREGGANPSTRLPGNTAIEREITRRIALGTPFAVCYCDLDNFKAYNDSYGFLKGDSVIQRTAQILLDVVREQGNSDDFVGHIGGDDFVIITSSAVVRAICSSVIMRFDTTTPLFYDRVARAQGYISGIDRQGQPTRFPLLSISIAVVSSEYRPFKHPGEVAQRSIDVKNAPNRLREVSI
ncbi:MAG: response regulator [Oscillochloris sp.]|nr:response regulator [Oscillochloris sp.]